MYLMDGLIEMAHALRDGGIANAPITSIYGRLEQKLVGAPRFLLDAAATRTAVELTLSRPTVILEAVRNLRIPYPKLWVEWDEAGRERLRREWQGEISAERPLPDRVGFLLECDETGRKGLAHWVWTARKDDTPNVGAIAPFFDLDGRFHENETAHQARLHGNLAKLWGDNPIQLAALRSLWETARHDIEGPWGGVFLNEMVKWKGESAIGSAMADVYGEYIMLWGCLLLLTSSRKAVELSPVDQSRLNRARARRKQPPRLDHTVVSLYLDPAERERQRRAPLGFARKSPRVHLVSSYLGRRGEKHWIVQPYMRGEGETISRHVKVKG